MNLGEKIKEIRKEKRLTIADVALKTGLSNGYISNVERNLNSPTIESLRKIVQALSISLVELFQDQQENSRVVRKNERVTIMKANDQSTFYELLSPSGSKEMGAVLVTLKPGAASGTEAHSHKGEEFGFIIKGSLFYEIGNETYDLEEGDSIYYDANIPHYYKNTGEVECISVWVVTPPSFS
ncbi:cupin domain-containing protein [Niallia sp. 03133]|uniref:cupin domain-containing protein n=1 Tax=Niallia sp. 03133 TaxID=3458060 RepID=UPI0040441266